MIPSVRRSALRRRLRAWYDADHRDLPWRRTRDPYRIWLAETMLQQTRVETVVPYYERFLERFPDVGALAAADEEDVLREWAGLGYYARARHLRRAAERIAKDFEGRIPRDPAELASLPGVGRYTVGALRSIAFRERAPLVDGNVKRVLSRLSGRRDLRERDYWSLAESLVPEERPDLFNQALMELGATVCTPRRPECARCPVEALCLARRIGSPESFPGPARRTQVRAVRAVGGVLWRAARPRALLLVRRPSRGLLGGLWELPSAEGDRADDLVRVLAERHGLRCRPAGALGEVRHAFTHRALTLHIVRLEPLGGRLRRRTEPPARWCTPAQLESLPLSTLARKSLRLASL